MSGKEGPEGRPGIREILSEEELKGMAQGSGMSSEELAKVLGPLSGLSGAKFQLGAAAGEALGRSLGWSSSKAAEIMLDCGYPAAVRGLVFALSSQRYALTTAFDTPYGAYFEAALPQDIFSYGGALQFDLADQEGGAVKLAGKSEVKGQMFDWGKGKRALDAVFAKTQAFAARLGG